MYNDVLQRFRTLIKNISSTNKEFCEKIGIPEATLKSLFQRNAYPTTEILIKCLNAYPHISIEWVLFGNGEMVVNKENQIGLNSLRIMNSIESMNQKIKSNENNFMYKQMLDTISDLSGKLAVAEHKICELEKQLLQKENIINDLEFRGK